MRNLLIYFLAVCFLALLPITGKCQELQRENLGETGMDSQKLKLVDKIIEQGIKKETIPGAVLLVGRKNSIVYWKAYGYKEVEPNKFEMEKDTIFDLASITKSVAIGTSISILAEDGKLSLEDKVAKYIPEFSKNGKEDVTIEMLLTHYSGLSGRKYHNTPDRIVERICEETPICEPNSEYHYSCLGYIILGKIVEIVSGKSLDQFAGEKIFSPLGMKDTMFNPSQILLSRCAPTVYKDKRLLKDGLLKGKPHDHHAYVMNGVAGNAGLFSTTYDLAIFAQCILNGGVYNGVRILNPETVKTMTSKASPLDKKKYRASWDVSSPSSFVKGSIPSGYSFGKTGWTGGVLWIYPERDLFIIFLSNRNHPVDKPNGSIITKQLTALVSDAVLRSIK